MFIWISGGGGPMGLLESPVLGRKYSVGNMINLRKILGLKLEKYWISLGL
jgi:hypothetical protein